MNLFREFSTAPAASEAYFEFSDAITASSFRAFEVKFW
jgi:hypothetical protein